MVYCGKPSRGCQMCRTRRIKCDETKPTCKQCAKSRRQCPGYKDDFDLVFRNETQATERRARKASYQRRASTQQSTFSMVPQGKSQPDKTDVLISPKSVEDGSVGVLPLVPLTVSIDQQAPCFFMSNYVVTPRQAARGYFDFLMPMLKTEDSESHLSLAFEAVSLASMANRPNTRGRALFPQAVGRYAKALKAVNSALQNPAQQKTDQTLAAILMLGFFENLVSEKSNAMAWYAHIDGAVQLVKMRGRKQLRTKIGYSLFACVRAQMIVSALSGSKSPALGTDWWIAEGSHGHDMFIARLNMKVAELRSEVNYALASFTRTPEHFPFISSLIQRAQDLEQEYQEWEATLPREWLPRTVAWVDQVPGGDIANAEVCPGKVDMFSDIYVAMYWNHARIARLFISGVIVRCAAWICAPVDYRTTPEYATAVRLCADLITDTIASIPYHLGWRIQEDGNSLSGDFSCMDDDVGVLATPKAIGGFFSMWPLFSISNTDYISDSQRLWAKGRLKYISDVIGLNHAKVLSNFQLRLPSMIIRRDAMLHDAYMDQSSAAHAICAPSPRASNLSPHITTLTIKRLAAAENTDLSPVETSPSPQSSPSYSLSPLQQREAMQRETWEREKTKLLKKASNSQGESVERLLTNYLAV